MSPRATQATKYEKHVNKQSLSVLSVKNYCEQHDLNRHTFQYYRKKFKEAQNSKSSPLPSSSSFTTVKLVSSDSLPSSSSKNSPSLSIDPTWLAQFIKNIWEEQ